MDKEFKRTGNRFLPEEIRKLHAQRNSQYFYEFLNEPDFVNSFRNFMVGLEKSEDLGRCFAFNNCKITAKIRWWQKMFSGNKNHMIKLQIEITE